MSAQPPPDADLGEAQPPDDDVLAGELVLGVLSADERRAAQRRGDSDPQFAARVARWEQRLAPWLAQVQPVPVPAQLWDLVRQRLGWQDVQPSRTSLWSSLAFWRAATAGAALVALGVWFARPVGGPPPASEASLAKPVTTLAQGDGSPGWLASVDGSRGTVLMVPVPRSPDEQGRVPELWIIPAGQAPRSLGAVSISKAHTVAVPDEDRDALIAPGSVLAVTLEPSAGMPHPAPSGPVIAKGSIKT
jgi:anti-sigma-K factor RskA